MRVFILGTGRCGSVTIIRACSHITNYTSGHESRSRLTGDDRLEYDDQHIEADNRLSWFLGGLNRKYGDEAIYVHLQRDRKETAESFLRRFDARGSIIHAFSEGIKMTLPEKTGAEKRLQICYDYVDTVNENIRYFLSDKTRKMDIHLDNIQEDFSEFWKMTGAEGDLDAALEELEMKYNASNRQRVNLKYIFILPILRLWRVCQ
ncbi:MAG: hypothetical protein K9J30_13705 [Bacteroidales bacterium]|nr:hypothetical protein [Bacteroidales bacterium]